MIPIICVGENLAQNEAGETASFVGGQVKAAFAGITAEDAAKVVVAYEPIWAIGTGKNAEPADANRIIGLSIRGALAELYGEALPSRFASSTAVASNPTTSRLLWPNPTSTGRWWEEPA
jgi:triosephosphate isomerase